MDSLCTSCCVFNALVGFITMVLVVLIFMRVPKPVSGFAGTPTLESDAGYAGLFPARQLTMMSELSGLGQTGSQVSGMKISPRAGFLGNPEAPVFYDVGDISSVYDTIVGAASDDSEGPVTDTRRFAAEGGKKSGFGVNIDRALAGY
jgi:hypothetical protein